MYYHVWFLTKYRRPVLEGKIDKFIREILTECVTRHKYDVVEMKTNRDHVHMLVKVEKKEDLPKMMRTIKSVSSREVRKTPYCKAENAFWARRYGFKEVREKEIDNLCEYIRNQKAEDPRGKKN
ncbi:IS200/IS605 family transposase [Candidatus Omnitrophota bacterium]